MALDKLVDSTQLDADLTTVANAIRTKGGTSAQLAFPQGMADAIAAIPSGGITPSGSISITENDTYDVTQYAEAVVNVSGGSETYPDLTDAPIPEGYLEVLYVVIDASAGFPHSSTQTTSTNMKGVRERGTYSNGVWTTISSTTFEGGQTIDWSDAQSGYVMFRFLITGLTSNMYYFDDTTPCVAAKLWSTDLATYWNIGNGLSMRHFIISVPNALMANGSIKAHIATKFTAAADGMINLIEKIDFRGTVVASLDTKQIFYNGLQNVSGLKSIKFPTTTPIQYGYARLTNAFQNCTNLEELDMSMWRIAATVTMADTVFDGCATLKTLNISNWDLSHLTTMSNPFRRCYSLENLITNNTIFPALNLPFPASSKLTDASLIGIANSLPVSTKTLTLHATPKARLTTIMGDIADGVFSADESGDTTLLSFINNTKGWTVA